MLGRQVVFYVVFVVAVVLFVAGSSLAGETGKALSEPEEGMVLISAGEFIRGIDEDDPLGFVWASPQSKVFLPDYYMDKFEVTNREYKLFVEATGHRVPFDDKYDTIYDWIDGTYTENLDDHPVVLVDWHDATAYCRWAGKRLPTEAEWEKAARGTDGRLWPWGNAYDRFKANTIEFNVQMTLPVGTFPEGASPYGLMDMAGNVFEWTSVWYKGYPGTKHQHQDYGELYKVVRSGTWTSPAEPYAYTMLRTAQPIDYKHRSLGFRCVRSVKAAK
ncbi:Serine/threonine protein kinase [hydrothermal vent metagenome]|uniref:Serine/threonine protein kinase n=1 Tax=hydrothermal vent metagenome TaxID=652676 RepID=A0A3B0QZ24_9ZZZZ